MDNFIDNINNRVNIPDLLNIISSFYGDFCYTRDQKIARQKLKTCLMIDLERTKRPLWRAHIMKKFKMWSSPHRWF